MRPTLASIAPSLFSIAVICATAADSQASGIGLNFFGTADLSAFGASRDSSVRGNVTWYPDRPCGPGGGGEGDFPLSSLDDALPCVTATLQLDAKDYNEFDLTLSRLMLFANGMDLQLWFDPPVDLDHGFAPRMRLAELGLWGPIDPEHPVFPNVGELPPDLSFLPALLDRSLVFSSAGCFELDSECVHSNTDPLAVVPEPSLLALYLLALSAAGVLQRTSPCSGKPEPSRCHAEFAANAADQHADVQRVGAR